MYQETSEIEIRLRIEEVEEFLLRQSLDWDLDQQDDVNCGIWGDGYCHPQIEGS